MSRTLVYEITCEHIGDILLSPSIFKRIYEEQKEAGNDVTLLPGLVLMKLEDGEVHYVWENDKGIVTKVYAYKQQEYVH